MQITTRLYLFITLALTVSVCSAESSVQSSRYTGVGGAAISSLSFVYHKSDMKFVSHEGAGTGTAKDTGFDNFGALLMSQAKELFANYGVEVVGVRSSKTKMPFAYAGFEPGNEAIAKSKMLFIYADSVHVNSSQHSTQITYLFNVRLLDPNRRKANWMASISSSTWVGTDPAMKNRSPVLYDANQAEQFLMTVAEKMKADGII
ncbi:MAG: hypothetical protein OQK78_04260 [Gammaproteobacteria bacterium]|nr:hypothetical protein [Gammaproteobacteria bacterium]